MHVCLPHLIEENDKEPGFIYKVTKDSMCVQTGDGALSLKEVQLEGKKRMEVDAFLRGNQVEEGTFFRK